MVGTTNSKSSSVKYKYILATTWDSDETYYERILTPYNPSRVEGTYLFVDKAYAGPARGYWDSYYGDSQGGYGSTARIFILEGKESGQTTSGDWAWIGNFQLWGKRGGHTLTDIIVNWGMDNGRNNGGPRLFFYSNMLDNLYINYENENSDVIMSIFDSNIIGNLRDFTDLCTVKVSDLIMGTDFQNRQELLELEGHTSLREWVESLTSYNKIELTAETFVPYKYFKKTLDEN